MQDLVIDLFAGGGGASVGIERALERPVDIALNHNPTALAVHERNHPETAHLTADIWSVRPRDATRGRPVSLLWASPDCRHHSRALGGAPRSEGIRSLADALTPWFYDARPELVCMENVPEFLQWGPLGPDGKPIKARRGEEFQRWLGEFRGAGYDVDWNILDASHYGAPTRRKRLFLVGRRDGAPITWPAATHGPGLLPFHTAAECIDWSLPCPSIFGRKPGKMPKPLVPKTMWRIGQALKRQFFRNPRPFILKVNHGKWEARHERLDSPLSTVTAQRRGHALVAPVLQQSGYGERPTQKARVLDLHQPLGTLVDGQKHALVSACLHRYFGDPTRTDGKGGIVSGAPLDEPIPTITSRDHNSLCAVALAKYRGTHENQPASTSLDEPLPTISAGGGKGGVHVAEVEALLDAADGEFTDRERASIALVREFLASVEGLTDLERLGIVELDGVYYQITDIGLRMLQPHELLRAQFGKYAEGYDLSPATTKEDQIMLIGNSVCPELAEALIRANMPTAWRRAA